MNESATLDSTVEWERIVNYAEQHNARCRFEKEQVKSKQQKRLNKALFCAMGAAVAVVMEIAGLLAPWVAVATSVVLLCAACYTAGKLVGNREATYGR